MEDRGGDVARYRHSLNLVLSHFLCRVKRVFFSTILFPFFEIVGTFSMQSMISFLDIGKRNKEAPLVVHKSTLSSS